MSEQAREAAAGTRADFTDSTPSSPTPPGAGAVSPEKPKARGGEKSCLGQSAP